MKKMLEKLNKFVNTRLSMGVIGWIIVAAICLLLLKGDTNSARLM